MSSNSLRIHIRRTHRNFNDLSAVNKSNSNVNETKNNVASENSYLDSKNESDSIITSNNTHHFINEYFLRHAENEIDRSIVRIQLKVMMRLQIIHVVKLQLTLVVKRQKK